MLLTEYCYLNNIKIDDEILIENYILSSKEEILLDNLKSVGLGGCCSKVLYIIVKQFGTASTGTAISTLHGIAAKNAIFSNIGFGTVASGGLGVAGGLAILGIITLAPLALNNIKKYKIEDCESVNDYLRNKIDENIYLALKINDINEKINKILKSKIDFK